MSDFTRAGRRQLSNDQMIHKHIPIALAAKTGFTMS